MPVVNLSSGLPPQARWFWERRMYHKPAGAFLCTTTFLKSGTIKRAGLGYRGFHFPPYYFCPCANILTGQKKGHSNFAGGPKSLAHPYKALNYRASGVGLSFVQTQISFPVKALWNIFLKVQEGRKFQDSDLAQNNQRWISIGWKGRSSLHCTYYNILDVSDCIWLGGGCCGAEAGSAFWCFSLHAWFCSHGSSFRPGLSLVFWLSAG